ncbi:MAG TPA: biotin-dependent carboxyltransferase family protein [Gemmatimonadaceae bacterium]
MTFTIIGAGLQTTVQDLGRPAHQRAAIPAGGAMDRLAARAANLLIGNDEYAALLETTLIGPTIHFHEETLIGLTGGDLTASLDGHPLRSWRAMLVPADSVLRFGQPTTGCRTYVAIAGGIDVPLVFGSRSTYLRANFGGLEGRALRAGDTLHTLPNASTNRAMAATIAASSSRIARWSLGATLRPHYSDRVEVRVVEAAHTKRLSPDSRAKLSGPFRVSASSDRMGYRLEGTALELRAPIELMSEGVAFGTVQLPPGGAPIVLMADRQTTGGYPRIAEVASVDLPLIAQLKPGDSVAFRIISLAEAQRLYLVQEAELAQARAGLTLRFSHREK